MPAEDFSTLTVYLPLSTSCQTVATDETKRTLLLKLVFDSGYCTLNAPIQTIVSKGPFSVIGGVVVSRTRIDVPKGRKK